MIPQYNTAPTTLCEKIADSSDGSAIWSAWAVIGFLSTDPRGGGCCGEHAPDQRGRGDHQHFPRLRTRRSDQEVLKLVEAGKSRPSPRPTRRRTTSPQTASLSPRWRSEWRPRARSCFARSGSRAAGCGAPPDVLRYWAAAVTCDHSNVLKTLFTHRASEAKKAANETISQQASTEDVKKHQVLSKIAESNAAPSRSQCRASSPSRRIRSRPCSRGSRGGAAPSPSLPLGRRPVQGGQLPHRAARLPARSAQRAARNGKGTARSAGRPRRWRSLRTRRALAS